MCMRIYIRPRNNPQEEIYTSPEPIDITEKVSGTSSWKYVKFNNHLEIGWFNLFYIKIRYMYSDLFSCTQHELSTMS